MLELARDFIAAGLLDRAETILRSWYSTMNMRSRRPSCYPAYQQLRDWEKAIDVAMRCRKRLRDNLSPLANYYCELAELDIQHRKINKPLVA